VTGRAGQAADLITLRHVRQGPWNLFGRRATSVKECTLRFRKGLLAGPALVALPSCFGVTQLEQIVLVVCLFVFLGAGTPCQGPIRHLAQDRPTGVPSATSLDCADHQRSVVMVELLRAYSSILLSLETRHRHLPSQDACCKRMWLARIYGRLGLSDQARV
jgi:hypothetical protein